MKITVSMLSKEGDSQVAVLEGLNKIQSSLEELFQFPAHFVAVEGEIVFSL